MSEAGAALGDKAEGELDSRRNKSSTRSISPKSKWQFCNRTQEPEANPSCTAASAAALCPSPMDTHSN